MRAIKKDLDKVVLRILTDDDYSRAKDLAKKCHVSPYMVYNSIRRLRIEGTGVHTTKKGYILSECASVRDDVTFVRRLVSRRTSDMIALSAARPHIERRFASLNGGTNMKLLFAPVVSSIQSINGSLRILSNAEVSIEKKEEKNGKKG